MIENINNTIEEYTNLRDKLHKQAGIIDEIESKARNGYSRCIFGDIYDFSVYEDRICVNTYEEGVDYLDNYTFDKILFSLSVEELKAHFAEKYKAIIRERELSKLKRDKLAEIEKEKKDREEFKRLNAKYRGNKNEK